MLSTISLRDNPDSGDAFGTPSFDSQVFACLESLPWSPCSGYRKNISSYPSTYSLNETAASFSDSTQSSRSHQTHWKAKTDKKSRKDSHKS